MIFSVIIIKAFVNETGLSKSPPFKTSSIMLFRTTGQCLKRKRLVIRCKWVLSTLASVIISHDQIRINSNIHCWHVHSSQHSALWLVGVIGDNSYKIISQYQCKTQHYKRVIDRPPQYRLSLLSVILFLSVSVITFACLQEKQADDTQCSKITLTRLIEIAKTVQ